MTTATRQSSNDRAEPGTRGTGRYFRIIVRPKHGFITFRNQDVGRRGGLQRLAGMRSSGKWDTHAWLVSKSTAHRAGKTLVADSKAVRELFDELGTEPVHQKGDIFVAKDRPDVPEKVKPTNAQIRARRQNIKKAQAARWKKN